MDNLTGFLTESIVKALAAASDRNGGIAYNAAQVDEDTLRVDVVNDGGTYQTVLGAFTVSVRYTAEDEDIPDGSVNPFE